MAIPRKMRSAPADDDRRISSNDRPLSLSSISLPVHAPDSPEASPLDPHIEANDYRSSHDSVRYVNQQQDGHARNRTQQQENLVHGECGPEGWTVEGEKGMDRFARFHIFGGRSYPGSTSCRQGHRPVYPGQPDVCSVHLPKPLLHRIWSLPERLRQAPSMSVRKLAGKQCCCLRHQFLLRDTTVKVR